MLWPRTEWCFDADTAGDEEEQKQNDVIVSDRQQW